MSDIGSRVSVVIVNFRGSDHTIACIEGVRRLAWPSEQLEVIVVDNASGDGSGDRIHAAAPDAEVIELDVNVGFAAGCNRGAAAASGRYLAFINNDARPDPQWLDAAVDVLERRGSVACVASKVLDWEGHNIDFVDAAVAFYGHGFKLEAGEPDVGAHDTETDVLFASGAAMVIDASVFEAVGGFDERYFMFFEDVDLGWRLWLSGYEVRYVPTSLVYHRHHASMADVAPWREHYLWERNALFTIYKNYDDENLRTMMPAALTLAIRRGVAQGGDNAHMLEVRDALPNDDSRVSVHKETLAGAFAVDAFLEELPELTKSRAAVQAARRRPDCEILPLFRRPLLANCGIPSFLAGFNAAVAAFGVDRAFGPRRRIVVATGDTLEPAMAGPAIRAWEIASALSREHDVELVTTNRCEHLTSPDFRVRKVNVRELKRLVDWCDIVIFQGNIMFQHPSIRTSNKIVIADIYDPFHLEQLEQARDLEPDLRHKIVRSSIDVLNEQLGRGDLFLCASAKQRDFWLGQLAGVGRINPLTYDDGERLERLVAIVPFGVGDTPPVHSGAVLKGVVPGIGEDDKVILWGGGVYNWFDPISLLHAVDKLRARLPQVRLYFLGMKHPNPDVPEMRMAVRTKALAEELGLVGSHVFFNEGWVPYEDRQNFLLESDVGVSTHLDHVETEFSFRTRILDYFWASLPVVATAGDSLAGLIEEHDVGITVPPQDVDALEQALFTLLTDDERIAACRRNATDLVAEFRWSRVLAPLVEFCRAPRRAPDLALPGMDELIGIDRSRAARPLRLVHLRDDIRTVAGHVRRGETKLMVRKAWDRIRRVASR